jgi:hypothetical protein
MDDSKTFTNETIIGKSMLKKEKIDNSNYFENSILNFMIVENYNKKMIHKKDIKK